MLHKNTNIFFIKDNNGTNILTVKFSLHFTQKNYAVSKVTSVLKGMKKRMADPTQYFERISHKNSQFFNNKKQTSKRQNSSVLNNANGLHKQLFSEAINALACLHRFYCWQN